MEAFFDVVKVIFSTENVAIMVLMVVNLALFSLLVWEHRENRADRREMLDLLNKHIDAFNELRISIATLVGRQS